MAYWSARVNTGVYGTATVTINSDISNEVMYEGPQYAIEYLKEEQRGTCTYDGHGYHSEYCSPLDLELSLCQVVGFEKIEILPGSDSTETPPPLPAGAIP